MGLDHDIHDQCARQLKILADPTRLLVVRTLLDGPRHVRQLNERIPVEQSLLSHHLRVLRDAGLVLAQRDGKAVQYRLVPDIRPDDQHQALDLGCCRLAFDIVAPIG